MTPTGTMKQLDLKCNRKIELVFHDEEDVKVALVDVACVPGFELIVF